MDIKKTTTTTTEEKKAIPTTQVASQSQDIDFVKEFNIEDVWTTGCALNTTGKIDN